MSQASKLPKTNSPLPSINFKHFISLIILLLVTSSTSQSPSAKYDCPSGCECNETALSARCDDLDELIATYSRKQHKSQHNFMPIKSLDLSNNQLTKLTSQLEVLVNLTELNLSHNELAQVHKMNFDQLDKLDLSYNRITSAKLKKLPKNVVHLNLAHNEITYLPVDFMKLKKLRSLELAGNPLNCTCNTLHVRNWMTYLHVRSDKPILCASPSMVKGQPWLQARQIDICIEPSSTTTQRSKYNWDNYEDDNEIMMGDEPQAEDVADVDYEEEEEEEEEETKDPFADASEKPEASEDEEKPEEKKADDDATIDEEFMPVSQGPDHDGSTAEPESASKSVADDDDDNEEGSGGTIIAPVSEEPTDDTEDSGSGFVPAVDLKDEDEASGDDEESTPLGIFDDGTEVPILHRGVDGANVDDDGNKISPEPSSGDMKKADSNQGTYILLGILALCLISLMVFVAMKNRKEKKRNRRFDVEKAGATELLDMDKRLLGKPLDKNGNGNGHGKAEQAPLINDYPAHDKPSMTYTSFQPPAITVDEPKAAPRDKEKSQQSLYENIPNGNGHIEPIHHSPLNGNAHQTPDSDDEAFHPANDGPISPESLNVSPEAPKRYSPIYTPASPRSERYSPVYSPETGRVKIKLTETPKPKTPVVVTRSRSRAGDYINTPN